MNRFGRLWCISIRMSFIRRGWSNKAVYRTRMALADGADLIVLAPGVKEFGEDKKIDGLIRKYGDFWNSSNARGCREEC